MGKRQIPKAFFEPLEHIKASDLLESDSLLDMVKKETPLAIEEAFRNKKTFATIFEVNGAGVYLDIPKQYWIPALETCIRFMIEKEDFEKCIPLRNLIEEIQKPVKKIPKKNSNGTIPKRNTNSN